MMIIRFLLIWMAFLPFSTSLEAGLFTRNRPSPNQIPPTIGVLVAHDRQGVVVDVKGKYRIFDPMNDQYISTRFIGKRKFMQALSDGLEWGEGFPGLHQLLIIPDHPGITTVVDGVEYRGSIYIYDVEGLISVVNQVDIEDYLHSVLSSQSCEALPQEVMAAVAIAERTNAYYQIDNPKSAYWAVDGSQTGYQGYAVTNRGLSIEQAIDATKYMTMSRGTSSAAKPQPFPARWGTNGQQQDVLAKISLNEADRLATNGDNAAQILGKAFPGTLLTLMYHIKPAQHMANNK